MTWCTYCDDTTVVNVVDLKGDGRCVVEAAPSIRWPHFDPALHIPNAELVGRKRCFHAVCLLHGALARLFRIVERGHPWSKSND